MLVPINGRLSSVAPGGRSETGSRARSPARPRPHLHHSRRASATRPLYRAIDGPVHEGFVAHRQGVLTQHEPQQEIWPPVGPSIAGDGTAGSQGFRRGPTGALEAKEP